MAITKKPLVRYKILDSCFKNPYKNFTIDVLLMTVNDKLLDFFDDESNSEFGLFQADIQARLHADNGENFSTLELMYKLDQQMKPKELGDDHFFEGLGSLESDSTIPKFYLFCGS